MASELNVGKVVAENSASQQIEIGDGAGSSWDFGRNTTSGSLVIRQNTTEKLAVSSTGLAVTGGVSATGAVTIGAAGLSVDAVNTFAADTGNWSVRNVRGNHTFAIRDVVAGSDIGTFSSTGLAVTGNVTATTLSTFSAGIAFQSATTSVAAGVTGSGYTLDKYETGTWTPSLTGTTETIDPTYTLGTYTRIGNLVYVGWYSGNMTLASSSGGASIAGLPFPVSNTNSGYTPFSYTHGNAVDGASRGGYFSKNTSRMDFVDDGGLATSTYVDGSNLYIMVSGVYKVD